MTTEQYLGRSRLFRRLKSGPHGQLFDLYAARLVEDGLASHGTWRCLNLAGGLLSWIASGRRKLVDLNECLAERACEHRAKNQSIQPGDRAALKRLLSVMRDGGTIAPAAPPPIAPPDQIFEAFAEYLRKERGLTPKSIVGHLPVIRRFLREVCPLVPAIAAGSARRPSSATSSAMPGIGARGPGKRCAGRCAHFSDTSIIEG